MAWLFKSYNAENFLTKQLLWNSLCLAHKAPQGSTFVWFSRLIFAHFLSPTLLVGIIASFVLKHLYTVLSHTWLPSEWNIYFPLLYTHTAGLWHNWEILNFANLSLLKGLLANLLTLCPGRTHYLYYSSQNTNLSSPVERESLYLGRLFGIQTFLNS